MLKKILFHHACFYQWSKEKTLDFILFNNSQEYEWNNGQITPESDNEKEFYNKDKQDLIELSKKELNKQNELYSENTKHTVFLIENAEALAEGKLLSLHSDINPNIKEECFLDKVPNDLDQNTRVELDAFLHTKLALLKEYQRIPHAYPNISQDWAQKTLEKLHELLNKIKDIEILQSGLTEKEFKKQEALKFEEQKKMIDEIFAK
jgi:hypothetical protein